MKWRVVEKRNKRRLFLFHRFIARHFNAKYAERYFDWLVANKVEFDEKSYAQPSTKYHDYLIDLLANRHGMNTDGLLYGMRGYGWNYKGWDRLVEQIESSESDINFLYNAKYIEVPAAPKVKAAVNQWNPVSLRRRLILKKDKDLKKQKVLVRMESEIYGVSELIYEMNQRIGVNKTGRRVIMELCPPDIVADFTKKGRLKEPEQTKVDAIINANIGVL